MNRKKYTNFFSALGFQKKLFSIIGICFILTLLTDLQSNAQANAQEKLEQSAISVSMARATWDTGWFQTEIFKKLIEELGYKVKEPKTMDNQEFYLSVAKGEVDLWANGWFPGHKSFVEHDQVKGRVEAVGFEVIAGALQGYLVDKKTADKFGIKNLDDLKNPEIARMFDQNGNGKADLIGCNAGWGCESAIDHHLDTYDLRSTVEHIQGDYSPLMHETIARYKQGKPILFYTRTPNWTVGTLIPGKDVVWIEVPFASLTKEKKNLQNQTTIRGVAGCVNDPCSIGFPLNDIRVVANKQFLKKFPDIKKLLELVTISLKDISRQNAKMLDGEDAYEDICRHAQEWIQSNRKKIDKWLKAAEKFQIPKKLWFCRAVK
ncbi:MAG: glycine betaine/L-proline ABC transporter substrate-binding protein ProX [Deltaproteobacteria bacterium]|jgi:glycine betaine/proline transport system substrate-binding protein|nr:glycine betaine/L-proline ABC transporter substrate-binding protein ProX [Deltaproteobacteria bacterium]